MKKKLSVLIKGMIIPLACYIFLNMWLYLILIFIAYVISYFFSSNTIFSDGRLLSNAVFITGLSAIVFFIIFYFGEYKKHLELINKKEDRFNIKNVKYIVILSFSSSLLLNILLLYIIPFTQNNEMVEEISENIYSLNIITSTIIIGVIIPLAEELLMRGYIYNSLDYVFDYKFAIIISSLIFAILHGNITQGIYAFILGIIIALIYKYYNNIIYCFIFHISANLFVYFFGPILESRDVYGRLFMIFISTAIMALSIYKIYLDKVRGKK